MGDEGLKHLEGLTQLRTLALQHTKVTNAGLAHLAGLSQLKYLGLDIKVTGVAIFFGKWTEPGRESLYTMRFRPACRRNDKTAFFETESRFAKKYGHTPR